ncbi:hypothetical protein [Agrobacterium vaccinii]|uniref:hypothetical protein n=1 Tax=Agrobacterium vaccinii TaxID=2735528 RepID=UPI001E5AF237|nr:hypothetical protein [Agrobacterium vaccinii]UHS58625.1 hypothetical protein HRS00_17170 [Agrobacterium vaccinii]
MPNLDGGHYFLTILIPIRTDLVDPGALAPVSHLHALRTALDRLLPAQQSPMTSKESRDDNSPFARSDRTHFARFFIIDDVAFNGRVPQNSLWSAVRGTVLTDPQPVDHLGQPFLAFTADFDPVGTGKTEPADYLRHLWNVMEKELRSVFQHCLQFDSVRDATGFASWVAKGQVETTMPFNDYWITPPPFPSISTRLLIILAAIPAIAFLVCLLGAFFAWAYNHPTNTWMTYALVAFIVTLLAVGLDYLLVMRAGAKPLPAAPNSDLRSVLKSLYLQQKFTDFIGDNQLASAAQVRAAFREFVARTAPEDIDRPTQSPGVIRS